MLNLKVRHSLTLRARSLVPLHVNIATIISVLLLVVVGGVVFYDQLQGRKLALAEAKSAFQSVGETLRGEFQALREPIETAVEATAAAVNLISDDDLLTLSTVRRFANRLSETDGLYALYYGNERGDFILVFNLAVAAPGSKAAYLSWIIRRPDTSTFRQSVVFLNNDLEVVSSATNYHNGYDPRLRPWYHAAQHSEQAIQTAPYIYFETNDIGITIAKKTKRGRGVVGGDLTLQTLSKVLQVKRLTKNSVAVIFDSGGHILSAGEIRHVLKIRRQEDRPIVAQQTLASAAHPAFNALSRLRASGISEGVHELTTADSSWISWLSPIPLGQGRTALLSVMSPADEVFATVNHRLKISITIAVAGIVVGLLLAWGIAKAISRPIGLLTDEAYQLRSFDLNEREPIRSRILEVHRLSEAVATLKRSLRDFSRYVPAQLVKRLVSGDMTADIGGERTELTFLFTDIANFTSISENREPMELMQDVSDYLARVSTVLIEGGATIDKYIGDAVMAMWNVPVAQRNHVEQACAAVLAAAKAVEDFNAHYVAKGKPPFETRFGLHVGEAVVGNVGSAERMNYTALGASVNLSARLEGLNKHLGTTILVSDAVQRRVSDKFLFRQVDIVRPKGAAKPVRVFELMANAPASEEQSAYLKSWQTALNRFQDRDWQEAATHLEQHARAFPTDKAADVLLQRAQVYAKTPPPGDWDGVFDVGEK